MWRKPWNRVDNQQTQPTFDAMTGNPTQTTLLGCDWSHHNAIPACQYKCQLSPLEILIIF